MGLRIGLSALHGHFENNTFSETFVQWKRINIDLIEDGVSAFD
jgi:hypothetical protein